MPKQCPKRVADIPDCVYVVKVELRDGEHCGHPIIRPSALAVNECYRTKEKAWLSLLEIAKAASALELARAGRRPSPASLNLIPYPTAPDSYSFEVLTADGLIVRYKIETMTLV